MKENQTVRKAAKSAIGVSEPTIIRWLRVPLPEEKEVRILSAIASLAREVG